MSLPLLHHRDVMKALEKAGFTIVGGKRNHIRMKKPRMSVSDKVRIDIIPLHGQIAKGTLRSIIDQAGVSVEEFLKLL